MTDTDTGERDWAAWLTARGHTAHVSGSDDGDTETDDGIIHLGIDSDRPDR